MRRTLLLIAFAWLWLLPTLAAAGSMTATLDRTKLRLGDSTTLRIQIEGDFDGQPDLRNIPPVSVSVAGRQQSVSISRGRTVKSYVINYRVVAREVGKGRLGPARLRVDGQELRSEYFEIEVLDAASPNPAPRTPSSGQPAAQTQPRDRGQPPAGAEGGQYFATASVSRPRPFEGESFLYQVKAYSAIRGARLGWAEAVDVGELSPEPSLEPQNSDHQEIIDRRRYTVTDIDVPLFSVKPGPARIGPAKFAMEIVRNTGFFGSTDVVSFQSNPVGLEVRPLPSEGKPNNFSGAVGDFAIEASLDRDKLDAGETATLTIRLQGLGGLRGEGVTVSHPEAVRYYPQKNADIQARITPNGVESTATYEHTLVPLNPGSITIPPVEFNFFDPSTEQYRVVKSRPLQMDVGGSEIVDPAVSERSAALNSRGEAVETLGTDIHDLNSEAPGFTNGHLSFTEPWVLTGLALPLLGFLGLSLGAARRSFAGTDAGQLRQRRAQARGALKQARSAAKGEDQVLMEAALKNYLVYRLGPRGATLAPDEAAGVLLGAGASQDVASGLEQVLQRLENIRYGGASTQGVCLVIFQWMKDAEGSWS